MKEGRYPFPNQRDGKDNHQLNIEFHAFLLKILERYTNSLLLFCKKSSAFRKVFRYKKTRTTARVSLSREAIIFSWLAWSQSVRQSDYHVHHVGADDLDSHCI